MRRVGSHVFDLVDDRRRPVPDLAALKMRAAPVVPGRAWDPEPFQEPIDAHSSVGTDLL
jgi:hypothetical protein